MVIYLVFKSFFDHFLFFNYECTFCVRVKRSHVRTPHVYVESSKPGFVQVQLWLRHNTVTYWLANYVIVSVSTSKFIDHSYRSVLHAWQLLRIKLPHNLSLCTVITEVRTPRKRLPDSLMFFDRVNKKFFSWRRLGTRMYLTGW